MRPRRTRPWRALSAEPRRRPVAARPVEQGPAERSYLHAKMNLHYPRKRKRRNFVSDPPSPRLRKGERGLDAAADAEPELPAHVDPQDARSVAYHRRSQWLNDAWKENRNRKRGPWMRSSSPSNFVSGRDKTPAVDH